MPIWYGYEPGGEVVLITEGQSAKAALIKRAGAFGLGAQSEIMPYQYVSVEGTATSVAPTEDETERRPMNRCYLGEEMGDLAMEAMQGEFVTIRMRPERWRTADYGKLV